MKANRIILSDTNSLSLANFVGSACPAGNPGE
jgi:hypothetical protein